MDSTTALQVLELSENASREDIKNAYRTLISVWHPDRYEHNPKIRSKAEEKTKLINAAYEVLADWKGFNESANHGQPHEPTNSNQFSQNSAAAPTATPTAPSSESGLGCLAWCVIIFLGWLILGVLFGGKYF